MSENSFPAGSYNDSKAPYNEEDYGECSRCEGDGILDVTEEHEPIWCPDCDGTGKKTKEQYLDKYESYLEDTRDA